jgi:hypothetical protein
LNFRKTMDVVWRIADSFVGVFGTSGNSKITR